jgi:hypothetical protein
MMPQTRSTMNRDGDARNAILNGKVHIKLRRLYKLGKLREAANGL